MNLIKSMLGNLKKEKTMTVEKAVSIFKNSEEQFDKFEKFYKENVLTEIPDNYFEVNSRQASKWTVSEDLNVDYKLAERIASELADGTHLIEVKNGIASERFLTFENTPIKTVEELSEIDPERQIQFTKRFSKFDMPPSESFGALVTFAKVNYGMFRGALETLDLSPSMYKILEKNKNSMGYWLPKVAGISDFKIPDTRIVKVPLSLLQLGRVYDYESITPTTFEVINRFCQKVFDLELNGEYFIKNGVYSSKYDFRNAKITSPSEVFELGQYLLIISTGTRK